jgi:hypothetical protein
MDRAVNVYTLLSSFFWVLSQLTPCHIIYDLLYGSGGENVWIKKRTVIRELLLRLFFTVLLNTTFYGRASERMKRQERSN